MLAFYCTITLIILLSPEICFPLQQSNVEHDEVYIPQVLLIVMDHPVTASATHGTSTGPADMIGTGIRIEQVTSANQSPGKYNNINAYHILLPCVGNVVHQNLITYSYQYKENTVGCSKKLTSLTVLT